MTRAEEILQSYFGRDYWQLEDRGDLYYILNAMNEFATLAMNQAKQDLIDQVDGSYCHDYGSQCNIDKAKKQLERTQLYLP